MATLRAALVIFCLLFATLILLPVHLICLRFFSKWANRIACFWHVLSTRALGLRIVVHGNVHKGPLLMIPNHVSWLDIAVLSQVQPLSFVAKSEVARWPIFSALAYWQRTVYVKRDQRRDTARALNEMAKRLQAGDTLVLFAEGTSSDGWQVLPFKSALIGAAISAAKQLQDQQSPLYAQPVAICYTQLHGIPLSRLESARTAWFGDLELIPHLMTQLKSGGLDVNVILGEPICIQPTNNRKQLTQTLQQQVKHLLHQARTSEYAFYTQNSKKDFQSHQIRLKNAMPDNHKLNL